MVISVFSFRVWNFPTPSSHHRFYQKVRIFTSKKLSRIIYNDFSCQHKQIISLLFLETDDLSLIFREEKWFTLCILLRTVTYVFCYVFRKNDYHKNSEYNIFPSFQVVGGREKTNHRCVIGMQWYKTEKSCELHGPLAEVGYSILCESTNRGESGNFRSNFSEHDVVSTNYKIFTKSNAKIQPTQTK